MTSTSPSQSKARVASSWGDDAVLKVRDEITIFASDKHRRFLFRCTDINPINGTVTMRVVE